MKGLRCDLDHIEEDPYSVVGFETVLLAPLVCARAKMRFFVWDNVARNPGFPLSFIKSRLNRYGLKTGRSRGLRQSGGRAAPPQPEAICRAECCPAAAFLRQGRL